LESDKGAVVRERDALTGALAHARTKLGVFEDLSAQSALSQQQERISTSLSLSASASAVRACVSVCVGVWVSVAECLCVFAGGSVGRSIARTHKHTKTHKLARTHRRRRRPRCTGSWNLVWRSRSESGVAGWQWRKHRRRRLRRLGGRSASGWRAWWGTGRVRHANSVRRF
jgi:hypothetical protein